MMWWQTVRKHATHRNYLFGLILVAITLFAYQPAWQGKPILDDFIHLPRPQNRSLKGLGNLWVNPPRNQQYHPLVDSVFWLEDRLWGQSMLGYHIINIVLHAGGALLLFKILRRLEIPGSWFAAVLFALHPVQVESVAFLNELKNVLSGLFLFAAVLAYLRFDQFRDRRSYWLAWLFVVVGLFAKSVTCYLPAVILIALWWKRGKIEWQRDIRSLIPFFVVGIFAAVATGWMEREFSDAKGVGFDFSPIERILIAGRAFWFYIGKIFWPAPLMMMYPRWKINPGLWWQYLYPATAILAVAVAWLLRRKWRGVWAGLLFFLLMLVPVMGFFNVRMYRSQFVSDHFQYLPIIGIVTPLAAAGAMLLNRWRGWQRRGGYGLVLLMFAILTTLTWRHSATFKDAETCYTHSAQKNPESWLAQGNLGIIRLREGRLDEAEFHMRKVLEIRPNHPLALSAMHLNLGHVLARRGQLDEATAHYQKSLELWPDFRGYNSIGAIQHRQGKLREAIASYEKALEMQPDSPVTQTNLAWILATAPDDNLRDGSRALDLSLQADAISAGNDPFFLHTLAAAYAEKGNFSRAIATAHRALDAANQRGMRPLADQLGGEIALYELGIPYRETGM